MPEGQAVEKPKKRKLLGFYIAAFVLLGLVVASAFLYEPLKLQYAIYRVRHTYSEVRPNRHLGVVPGVSKWFMYCLQAAQAGNPIAMDAILDHSWVTIQRREGTMTSVICETAAYLAAKAQPRLFFDRLEVRSNQEVMTVLMAVCGDTPVWPNEGLRKRVSQGRPKAAALEEYLRWWAGRDPDSAQVAQASLTFIRRRFAKELAEAEKKAVEEKK